MRKLYAILALLLVFTLGCKKEDEMTLSEFIIGEWDSELTAINPGEEDEMLLYFYAEFKTNMFDLDFLSYPEKIVMYSIDSLNYTIINEFNMTIDNPMEEGTVSFDIVWNSAYDKMVWIPDSEDGAPTMVYTKR